MTILYVILLATSEPLRKFLCGMPLSLMHLYSPSMVVSDIIYYGIVIVYLFIAISTKIFNIL